MLPIASLGTLCNNPSNVYAGLIFQLDAIDAHQIDSAEIETARISVSSRGRVHIISLPAGASESLIAWARNDTGGPIVLSIDSSLVSTDGGEYWPPSMPRALANLLFSYDSYAHGVACGATPARSTQDHPLVNSAGEQALPYRMHEALLHPANRSPQAYAYRQLAERFVDPPTCVGELTLYAIPGTGNAPVAIQPRSWVHMVTNQWYRGIDVASEADKWVARLPYQPLKQDLEERWLAYRSAFPTLDSLSATVEAMALLRAIKRDAPRVWRALDRSPRVESLPLQAPVDKLRFQHLERDTWRRLSYRWIGDRVDTPAEANLALGLAAEGDLSMLAMDGLDVVAARDPLTRAKLQLMRLRRTLEDAPDAPYDEVGRLLFATLAQMPHSFRLRAIAISMLRGNNAPTAWLGDQERQLESDFAQRAQAACATDTQDLVIWENLSQDIYSVGLLPRFERNGRLPSQIATATACVHFRRATVVQQDRQLAFRHGHYRFLKYLSMRTDDPQVRSQILTYRRILGHIMNLHDADVNEALR